MKKIWLTMMILVPFLIIQISFNTAVFAASSGHTGVFTIGQSQYVLDGQTVAMDVAPVINNGRTLVPVRYLAYALGLTANDIGWDPVASSVDIAGISNGTEVIVKLTVGSETLQTLAITKNAQNLEPTDTQMDAAPTIINGRVYLPARYVVEAFDGTVAWDAATQEITVTSNVSSCYANWATVAPSNGQYTAALPDVPVPISIFFRVGGEKVACSMMVSKCSLVDYEVGYMALTSNITDDAVKALITSVSESSHSMLMFTKDVLLSGLPAKEALMMNDSAMDITTLCVCYQGSMLWYCLVTHSEYKDVTENATKFFDSFKLDAEPNGQTTVMPQKPQSATGNGSGNGSNGPLTNWNARNSQTSERLFSVVFGNNTFVAVGANGTILTSPDGANWTNTTTDNATILDGIVYGNGIFLAVGSKDNSDGTGYGVVLKSTDGAHWSDGVKLGVGASLDCVAFGNGTFVVGGQTVSAQPGETSFPMWSSHDGVNWTPVQVPNGIYSVKSIAYGDNLFVAIGISGTIMTSPNGTIWTVQKPGQSFSTTSTYILTGVAYGNNTFVAVGSSGTVNPVSGLTTFNNGVVLTSSDGTHWNNQLSGYQGFISGVAYGNQTFVALGSDGVILTSKDGHTWASQNTGVKNDLFQTAYGNNTFVIVGDKGIILQSGATARNSGQ